jgi:hypothetical protein
LGLSCFRTRGDVVSLGKVAVHSVKLALHDFGEYGIKGEWTLLSN